MAAASDAEEHNFWPGYVDTLVNMVMFLILLIVILVMAVMYFSIKAKNDAIQSVTQIEQSATPIPEPVDSTTPDESVESPVVQEMRKQIEQLKEKLHLTEQKLKPKGQNPEVNTRVEPERRIAENSPLSPEGKDLNKIGKGDREIQATQEAIGTSQEGLQGFALRPSELIIRFRPGVLDLTDEETARLKKLFMQHFDYDNNREQNFVLSVNAVDGLSESNRMAFYRVVAVRNRLIAVTGVPASKIMQKINTVPAAKMSGVEGLEVRITKVD